MFTIRVGVVAMICQVVAYTYTVIVSCPCNQIHICNPVMLLTVEVKVSQHVPVSSVNDSNVFVVKEAV